MHDEILGFKLTSGLEESKKALFSNTSPKQTPKMKSTAGKSKVEMKERLLDQRDRVIE